jgi:hypothetical protein
MDFGPSCFLLDFGPSNHAKIPHKVVTIDKQREKIHEKGLGSQYKHKTMDNEKSC